MRRKSKRIESKTDKIDYTESDDPDKKKKKKRKTTKKKTPTKKTPTKTANKKKAKSKKKTTPKCKPVSKKEILTPIKSISAMKDVINVKGICYHIINQSLFLFMNKLRMFKNIFNYAFSKYI